MAKNTTDVKYNGYSFAAKDQPIPFVSQSNEYVQVGGESWVIKKNINLIGVITYNPGCDPAKLWKTQNEISNAFSKDFETLEIDGLDNCEYVKVTSVDFEQSTLLSHIDFNITLECYDQESFIKVYKVIEPKQVCEFVEQENKTMLKNITVSAKGVHTDKTALENAKNFVEDHFDGSSALLNLTPAFIDSKDPNYRCILTSTSEEINRIEGTYSKTKTYASDLEKANGSVIFKYTKEIIAEVGEFIEIVFSGSVEFGLHKTDADRVAARDVARDEVEEFAKKQKGDNYRVLDLDFDEDARAGVLNFTFRLTEDLIDVLDDWTVSINESAQSSLISATIKGKVTAKGPKECRWGKVSNYFFGEAGNGPYYGSYYYDTTQEYYERFVQTHTLSKRNSLGSNLKLCQYPISSQIVTDEKNGIINYSFDYSDKMSILSDKTFYDVDYNFKCKPSNWKVVSAPAVDGKWAILDLGFRNRFEYTLDGYCVGSPLNTYGSSQSTDKDKTRDFIEDFGKQHLEEKYGKPGKLWKEQEGVQLDMGPNHEIPSRSSFTFVWSFYSDEPTTAGRKEEEWVTLLPDGLLGGDYKFARRK